MGYRPDNPAGDALGQALGRQQTVVQHMRASQAAVTTKRAFEFLVLTAARSGEVRLATWDEMDLDAGVWAIPAVRMKAKRDHRVSLSGRALAILHVGDHVKVRKSGRVSSRQCGLSILLGS